jgi:hypothetical protein
MIAGRPEPVIGAFAMRVWQLTELSRVCIISLFIERQ